MYASDLRSTHAFRVTKAKRTDINPWPRHTHAYADSQTTSRSGVFNDNSGTDSFMARASDDHVENLTLVDRNNLSADEAPQPPLGGGREFNG
jgi:hypothetical protein